MGRGQVADREDCGLLAGERQARESGLGVAIRKRSVCAAAGAIVLVSLAAALVWYQGSRARGHVNLLLITIDTLRADHLGCYGYGRDTSPEIDELARSGTLFEEARVQWPKTNASMASMLTSTYSSTNRVRGAAAVLDRRLVTLAEMLRERGYYCASVVANAHLGRAFRFDQGFSEVHEMWANRWMVHNTTINSAPYDNEQIAREVVSWLGRNKDRRFFLWVHFLDPHGPYRPPAALEKRFAGDDLYRRQRKEVPERMIPWWIKEEGVQTLAEYVARYDAEITSTDRAVGRLLSELKRQGLAGKSLVVLAADHGESLGEHDYYFQHGRFLYDRSLRVPLILSLPGLIPAGRRVRDQVGLVDLVPTILELLGFDSSLYREQIEGRSFAELLFEPHHFKPRPVFSEAGGKQVAVVEGRWKLIERPRAEDGRWQLFDLRGDPGEERNVAPSHPEVVARLRRRMDEWRRRKKPSGYTARRVTPEKLEEGVRRQLESLGYLDKGRPAGK